MVLSEWTQLDEVAEEGDGRRCVKQLALIRVASTGAGRHPKQPRGAERAQALSRVFYAPLCLLAFRASAKQQL